METGGSGKNAAWKEGRYKPAGKQIDRDVEDGIKTAANNKITLNDMVDLYMAGKYELKDFTRSNYLYMYENDVSDEIGRKKVASIKYSDVKAF